MGPHLHFGIFNWILVLNLVKFWLASDLQFGSNQRLKKGRNQDMVSKNFLML